MILGSFGKAGARGSKTGGQLPRIAAETPLVGVCQPEGEGLPPKMPDLCMTTRAPDPDGKRSFLDPGIRHGQKIRIAMFSEKREVVSCGGDELGARRGAR